MKKSTNSPKPFEPKRAIESVRYPFDATELRQLGADLAHRTREAIRIENDKKVATSSFTAAKKEVEAQCAELSLKIENGYEMRDAECMVYFSTPRPGFKTIVRADNNEVVREEPMTAEEMQAAFEFPDEAKNRTQ